MEHIKQLMGILSFEFAFFAFFLIEIINSRPVWAQCSPARTGPSSGNASGVFGGDAGMTFTIDAAGGNPFFQAGSTDTVGPAGMGIGDVGEPFEFGRHRGELAELRRRERALFNRHQVLRHLIRHAAAPCSMTALFRRFLIR
jgi:hypothetical protein